MEVLHRGLEAVAIPTLDLVGERLGIISVAQLPQPGVNHTLPSSIECHPGQIRRHHDQSLFTKRGGVETLPLRPPHRLSVPGDLIREDARRDPIDRAEFRLQESGKPTEVVDEPPELAFDDPGPVQREPTRHGLRVPHRVRESGGTGIHLLRTCRQRRNQQGEYEESSKGPAHGAHRKGGVFLGCKAGWLRGEGEGESNPPSPIPLP